MKHYKIRKHYLPNVKIHVIVQSDDDKELIIPPGGFYDKVPVYIKAKMPRKIFFHNLKKTEFYGKKIEYVFPNLQTIL